MRLYLGLLLTTAIEAVVTFVVMALVAAVALYALAQDVKIEAVVIVGFAALVIGLGAVYKRLRLDQALQGMLRLFAGEPEPELTLKKAKSRALMLAVLVSLGLGPVVFLTLALLLSSWLQTSMFASLTYVIFLELLIGAPGLVFFGSQAYSRARAYLYRGRDELLSPDLDDRIRASLDNDLKSPS